MNIIVCIKQVPDTESPITVDPRSREVLTKGITYILNPYDELAIEEAVRIKETIAGSQVTAISYGPSRVEKALRTCLAMGADQGIMILDEMAEGSDTSVTALVLSKLIKNMAYDLILCGKRSLDSDTSQLGPYLAEYLHIANISSVTRIQIEDEKKKITAHRQIEGMVQVVESKLPALLTAERGLNEPRVPPVTFLLKAKRAKISSVDLDHIGIAKSEVGMEGSKVKVVNYSLPKPRRDKNAVNQSKLSASERLKIAMSGGMEENKGDDKIIKGDYHEGALILVKYLSQNKFI